MKRLLTAFALAAGVLLLPTVAFAYSYTFPCGPSWASLPVPYWINSAGSDDIPFAQVQSIIEDSFAEWGDPCCSRFSAAYQGTTGLTATNNQGRVVLSWVESNWNPGWGNVNQTIGITFTSVYNNCSIAEGPIVFNGIGFRFTTNGSGTDLQSIATHEIGHLLGLGHSNLQDATMYAAYIGGTGARSLHQDDINGVCSLYTTSCSCTSSTQCASDEACIGGQCQKPPCTSNADCDSGLECDALSGDCRIPPCSSSADCGAGFVCQNSICVSGCPVCRRNCTSNSDCGNGFCVDNTDGTKVCLVLCGQGSECPGDSVCYPVSDGQGGDAFVCGDPNAVSQLCPPEYTCQDGGISDECATDADCSGDQQCLNTVDGRRCQTAADRCADVTCGDGLTCNPDNGLCYREDIGNNQTGDNNTANNTPGNNTPGNNTPGNNTPGTNTSGQSQSEDPVIVIFADETAGDDGCATVTARRPSPGALLLILGALFWLRRRR